MNRIAIVVLLVAAVVACSKKDSSAQPGSGSSGPQPRPSQSPQPPLPALELPPDPKRDAKVELGHTLFFDKRLSAHNDRACYSCHMNEDGNGGHDPLAIGSGGKVL